MADPLDRAVASLRAHHDRLAQALGTLGSDQLAGPSAASEWSVAQVLSHLGSGAEIWYGPYSAGLAGQASTPADNQAIWDRWNASSPEEQVAGFLEHDERFVALLEATTADQRATATVDLGFFPEPVPLARAVGMRLNEVALHTWDVLAGIDASATVDAEAADLLLDEYAGSAAYMLGFIGKPEELAEPAVVDLDGYTLRIDDAIAISQGSPAQPSATLHGPHEAALRLVSGRLKPGYTADEITVSGNVALDDLRKVFPGY
jgi:uncharacterized protein (TIGR03083 family)